MTTLEPVSLEGRVAITVNSLIASCYIPVGRSP